MKKNLLSVCSVIAIATSLGVSGSAHAQSMDYSSLESLFGEPVTTSATGTPQRSSEVAANMTIITADEIRQSGTRSIPQILARVPGLDILQASTTGYDVGVRGYQQGFQPRLLVLLDGRQVFLDDYSRTIWDNIPVNIDDIRQIEVVKGAASALFGSNAAGGVINIVTYSPKYDNNNTLNVTMGTQNMLQADGTATIKPTDKITSKISAGGLNGNQWGGFQAADGGNSFKTNPDHRYVIGNNVFQVTPNVEANFEASYDETKVTDAVFQGTLAAENPVSYSFRGGVAWQSPYGLIKNDNYVNQTNSNYTGLGLGVAAHSTLWVSSLQDQFKVGADNTFRVGLEYRHKEFKAGTSTDVNLPNNLRNDYDVYAISGTWLWNITDKLSLTTAGRLDHQNQFDSGTDGPLSFFKSPAYTRDINALTANVGLAYRATDKDTIRVTYARGAQLPSMVQNGYAATLPYAIAGLGNVYLQFSSNPNVKPTIVSNYEVAYDRKVDQINSVAKIAAFYELNQNMVGYVTQGAIGVFNGLPVVLDDAQNVGNSSAYGMELEVKGASKNGIRWDASYSVDRVMDSTPVYTALGMEKSAPEQHLRADLGYSTGPWELDGYAAYQSHYSMNRAIVLAETPTYTSGLITTGARVGYKLNDRFTAAVSAQNINRSTTDLSPYLPVQRTAFVSLTGKF